MSMYELLLLIHLLAMAVWFGGGLALNVISTRTPPPDRAAVAQQVSFYGQNVLTGSSLVLMLSGFGLVAELDLGFGDTWIWLGMAIWLATFAIGAGLVGPTSKKLSDLATSPDPDVAQLGALRGRMLLLARVTLVLVFLALIDMVLKPGL